MPVDTHRMGCCLRNELKKLIQTSMSGSDKIHYQGTNLKYPPGNVSRRGPKVFTPKYTLVFGSLMYLIGVILLFYCEWEAVTINQQADELLKSVVKLPAPMVRPENENKLVHVMGQIDVDEPLTEVDYGVSVPAIKLKRRVQLYQWVEEKESSGDELTMNRNYVTEWRDKLINSSVFVQPWGHENPKSFPMNTIIYVSERVTIGNFVLNSEIKDIFKNWVFITGDQRPERNDVKLHAGLYYHCIDVWEPEVGDIRVQFAYAGLAGDIVSIIAQQHGNELRTFKNASGTGLDIALIAIGRKQPVEMFHFIHREQSWHIKFQRVISCILLYMGSTGMSQIIQLLVFPKRRFQCPSPYAVIMIILGLSWFYHYPVLSSGLIAGAIILIQPFFSFTQRPQNRYHSVQYQPLK